MGDCTGVLYQKCSKNLHGLSITWEEEKGQKEDMDQPHTSAAHAACCTMTWPDSQKPPKALQRACACPKHRKVKSSSSQFIPLSRNNGKRKIGLVDLGEEIT